MQCKYENRFPKKDDNSRDEVDKKKGKSSFPGRLFRPRYSFINDTWKMKKIAQNETKNLRKEKKDNHIKKKTDFHKHHRSSMKYKRFFFRNLDNKREITTYHPLSSSMPRIVTEDSLIGKDEHEQDKLISVSQSARPVRLPSLPPSTPAAWVDDRHISPSAVVFTSCGTSAFFCTHKFIKCK